MASVDLLSTCPRCKGVWLTSTMSGGHCHVCAGQLIAAQRRMKQTRPGNVMHKQQVTIPEGAKCEINAARVMYGVLEGEARRL